VGQLLQPVLPPFIHIPNTKITSEVINTFFHQPALPLSAEGGMIGAKAS
jgi:hypothetical protein